MDGAKREVPVVFLPDAEGEDGKGGEGGDEIGGGLSQSEPFDGDGVGGSPKQEGADGYHHHAVEDADDAVPFEEHQPFEVAAQVKDERIEELVEGEDCQK